MDRSWTSGFVSGVSLLGFSASSFSCCLLFPLLLSGLRILSYAIYPQLLGLFCHLFLHCMLRFSLGFFRLRYGSCCFVSCLLQLLPLLLLSCLIFMPDLHACSSTYLPVCFIPRYFSSCLHRSPHEIYRPRSTNQLLLILVDLGLFWLIYFMEGDLSMSVPYVSVCLSVHLLATMHTVPRMANKGIKSISQ